MKDVRLFEDLGVTKKKSSSKTLEELFLVYVNDNYPLREASAPPTISKISFVITS